MTGRLRRLSASVVIVAGIFTTAIGAIPTTARAASDNPKLSVLLDTMTLLNGRRGDIEVLQILRVQNASGQAFAGTGKVVFKLPVPESAFDVAPSDDTNPDGMAQGPEGIFTTRPIPPGEVMISYIYRIKTTRAGWALRRQVDYPTRSVDVLLGPGLDLKTAPGFTLAARKKLGGSEYRRFRAGPFTAGSVLTANIGFEDQGSGNIWVGFGSAVAIAAALALAATRLTRHRKAAPAAVLETDERGQLIDQIALLDEEFDSGSLREAAYRSRREKLKSRLADITEASS